MTPERLEEVKNFIIDVELWPEERIVEEMTKRGITTEELIAFDDWTEKELFSDAKQCPQCGEGYLCSRFCEICGWLLPLPRTVEELEKRENEVEDHLDHEDLKIRGCKFCPKCGRKL